MLARGDQVQLPNGKGVGIVVYCNAGAVGVFVGRQQIIGTPVGNTVPMIDEYVECELRFTGKHFAKVGRDVEDEWRDMVAAKRRPQLAIVTGA